MMTYSRRGFLESLGFLGCVACQPGWAAEGAPLLRFGVLSDSHVTKDPSSAEPLRRLFAHFAAENVDAVVHCGDICHLGKLDEFAHVLATWHGAFPGGKNAAGGKVFPFFVYGNHDYHQASFQRGEQLTDELKKEYMLYNRQRIWEELTGEPFPGEVFSKEIKGFTFLGAHWSHEGEIAAYLAAHPVDPTKPFFHVRHPHPKATCFGAWASGSPAGVEELLKHPNAFVMSGHSHINVGNDRGLWQGGFASMGAGSAGRVSNGAYGGKYDNTSLKKDRARGHHWHTPLAESGGGWEGSIVSVYADHLVIERRDYRSVKGGELIGAPWIVGFPFEQNAAHPYRVADAARAPRFVGDEKISFEVVNGKLRPENTLEKQLKITLPAAQSDGPQSRPGYYRFEILEPEKETVVLSREIIAEYLTNSEKRASGFPVRCHFAITEVPAAFRVRVTPLNAGEKPGNSVVSAVFHV